MIHDTAPKVEINMPYDIALGLAWDEMVRLSPSSRYVVPLLTETYEVDIDSRTVLSMSSGIPAEESIAVLILHYLMGIQKQQGFSPSRDWISSREVEGGISFLPAFQESVIKPLIECLGIDPDGMIRDLWKVLGVSGTLSCGHPLSHVCQIWMRAMST
jgi:hypothetical protein